MQKIPTLYIRDKANPKRVTSEVDPECQWVLDGLGTATEKVDGSACAVIGGRLYKRHQHKAEKGGPPEGWLHWSGEPDQRSGHGWLPVIEGDSSNRYHLEAWALVGGSRPDGTYELVGPKSNGNPHRLHRHELWPHGKVIDDPPERTFDAIRDWLGAHPAEGIVWHASGRRMAKIKRRDFGFKWPKP